MLLWREEGEVHRSCSGGQAMTLVVRMTGGPDGRIEVPFMIVQNEKSNYPIRGVPENVPGSAIVQAKAVL